MDVVLLSLLFTLNTLNIFFFYSQFKNDCCVFDNVFQRSWGFSLKLAPTILWSKIIYNKTLLAFFSTDYAIHDPSGVLLFNFRLISTQMCVNVISKIGLCAFYDIVKQILVYRLNHGRQNLTNRRFGKNGKFPRRTHLVYSNKQKLKLSFCISNCLFSSGIMTMHRWI